MHATTWMNLENIRLCEGNRSPKMHIVLFHLYKIARTSLVVQWLRICLLMQGTWVRALVQEDPTCCGATKLVRHNY